MVLLDSAFKGEPCPLPAFTGTSFTEDLALTTIMLSLYSRKRVTNRASPYLHLPTFPPLSYHRNKYPYSIKVLVARVGFFIYNSIIRI